LPDKRNKFQVALTEHAITDLEDIPAEHQDQINSDLKTLGLNSFPHSSSRKRLRGFRPPLYRLRSENFRILYRIQEKTMIILRVLDRKMLDRFFRRRSGI
jgi:mRNA-degrading endonuclease RelE of RelBE toxin-antitoxin system